ncbi:MAG TPA: hypothetical protein VN892_02935 [Solirubrobacteraceae bacterium]|nr:hypothetical protein [Solirubrobacteraceae bacterium]
MVLATVGLPATAAIADAGSGVTALAGGAPLTKARATAFARAVNLTAADVPGFTVVTGRERERESAAEKRLEREMLDCVHPASGKQLAGVSSQKFKRESSAGQQSVQSEVSVARTSSAAAKELVVIRSAHSRACMSHYLDLLLQGEKSRGATFAPVSIAQGTPSAPGTTGTFAWRITLTVTVHGVTISTYIDILGFVYGPAQVSLFASGLPQPFPAAGEQKLFSLLVRRATAQSL